MRKYGNNTVTSCAHARLTVRNVRQSNTLANAQGFGGGGDGGDGGDTQIFGSRRARGPWRCSSADPRIRSRETPHDPRDDSLATVIIYLLCYAIYKLAARVAVRERVRVHTAAFSAAEGDIRHRRDGGVVVVSPARDRKNTEPVFMLYDDARLPRRLGGGRTAVEDDGGGGGGGVSGGNVR